MTRFYINLILRLKTNGKIFISSIGLIALFVLSSTFTSNLVILRAQTPTKSIPSQTRSDQWIEDLQANYNNPEWYYLNLNSVDRYNIRLALDYAIPRADIINTILNGFGTYLPTTEVPQAGMYYNNNVTTRQYDIVKAQQLLTQVFGYTYSPIIDNTSTPYIETLPYFPMGFLVPNTSSTREQWANRIMQTYSQIGIKTVKQVLSFDQITARVWNNSAIIGLDFAHGGFDGLFIGWACSTIPDDGFFFYSSQSIPFGNYQYVNSSYLDQQINIETTNRDIFDRLQAYHNVQTYLHDQVVRNVLFQQLSTYLMSNRLQGFNPFYAGQGNVPYQMWNFSNSKTNLVVAIAGDISNWNPLLSNAVYDSYFMSQMWAGGLVSRQNQPNDPTFSNFDTYNNLASWYNVSADGLTYFFSLKPGLTWQDGTPLTTTDVYFTYMAAMNKTLNAPAGPTLRRQLNNNGNGMHIINSTMIEFELTSWDPLTIYNLFELTIIPAHIYANISYEDWSTDPTNTGETVGGIVGSGPYQFVKYENHIGYLQAWPGWNSSYDKLFENEPVHGVPMISDITITVISDPTTALASLKSGGIDYAGTNIGFQGIYSIVKASSFVTSVNATGAIWQELGLNHASPIWGLSPRDFWGLGPQSSTIPTTTPIATSPPVITTPSTTIATSPLVSTTPPTTSSSSSTTHTITKATPGFEFNMILSGIITLTVLLSRRRKV